MLHSSYRAILDSEHLSKNNIQQQLENNPYWLLIVQLIYFVEVIQAQNNWPIF